MTTDGLRFHAEYSAYADLFRLHVARGSPVTQRAAPIEFVGHEPGLLIADEPALSMTKEDAQALIDALWVVGLRPQQGRQSEGVTAAQDRHLQDMRAIAFAKLGVATP